MQSWGFILQWATLLREWTQLWDIYLSLHLQPFSLSVLTSFSGDTPFTWFRGYSLQSFMTSSQLGSLNIKTLSLLAGPATKSQDTLQVTAHRTKDYFWAIPMPWDEFLWLASLVWLPFWEKGVEVKGTLDYNITLDTMQRKGGCERRQRWTISQLSHVSAYADVLPHIFMTSNHSYLFKCSLCYCLH